MTAEPFAYPNREHRNADIAARRRALTSVNDLIAYAEELKLPLERGDIPDPGVARSVAGLAAKLSAELAALEVLRDVREWDEADQAEAPVIRIIRNSDVARCPGRILLPQHYRDDGSCLCRSQAGT